MILQAYIYISVFSFGFLCALTLPDVIDYKQYRKKYGYGILWRYPVGTILLALLAAMWPVAVAYEVTNRISDQLPR